MNNKEAAETLKFAAVKTERKKFNPARGNLVARQRLIDSLRKGADALERLDRLDEILTAIINGDRIWTFGTFKRIRTFVQTGEEW